MSGRGRVESAMGSEGTASMVEQEWEGEQGWGAEWSLVEDEE